MSIKARLTISYVSLSGVLIIALALAAYLLIRNNAYATLDSELHVALGATALSAEHELNEHSTRAAGENDLRSVLDGAASPDLTDTQILVREGGRVAAYKGGKHSIDLRSIGADHLKNATTLSGLRVASRILPIAKFHAVYEIYSAKPLAPAEAQMRRLSLGLLIFIPLGLSIAGFVGYLLALKALRPLNDFAETINSVTSSDLSARVQINHHEDEIHYLGSRFNFLLDRLQEAFNLQRRFMADASHQIRTPVAVALTASQVMNRDSATSLGDCREALRVVEHQMIQLRRTVEDMFFLSQADSASLRLNQKEMYLDDAVSGAARAARTLAVARQQQLKVTRLPEARCVGDEDLLKQSILILLDNAVKFTPPKGNIHVALTRREDQWICAVSDDGAGISEAAKSRIFERFFRQDQSSREAVPGAGLGLAIAKSILESHGGRLTLVESRPGKTVFEIALPALPGNAADEVHPNSLAVKI
jgi:two-component system, OmpR family, sensor kinase